MEEYLLCYIEMVALSFLEVVFRCTDDHLLGFYSLLHVWSDILENNEYSYSLY